MLETWSACITSQIYYIYIHVPDMCVACHMHASCTCVDLSSMHVHVNRM